MNCTTSKWSCNIDHNIQYMHIFVYKRFYFSWWWNFCLQVTIDMKAVEAWLSGSDLTCGSEGPGFESLPIQEYN